MHRLGMQASWKLVGLVFSISILIPFTVSDSVSETVSDVMGKKN